MTQEVQPLTWSKRTNLEEHQQFFSKINEIIDNLAPTVDEAEAAIAQATQALTDANAAAQQAQTAAATVAGYNTRLTAVEGEADTNADNITALQNVQADYVKKDGAAQTVTSQIMVPTTATGVRNTQIANGTRIQNDLAAYEPMVRTTGNQLVEGTKNYPNLLQRIYQANTHVVQSTDLAGGEYSSQLVAVTTSTVDVNLFFMWHNTRKGIAPQVGQCGFISAGFRPNTMKIISIAGTVPQNHFAITRRVVNGQNEYRLWSTGQIKNIDIMYEGIGANNVKVWTRDSAPITSTDLTVGYDEVVYL